MKDSTEYLRLIEIRRERNEWDQETVDEFLKLFDHLTRTYNFNNLGHLIGNDVRGRLIFYHFDKSEYMKLDFDKATYWAIFHLEKYLVE